ncbi:MAG: UDP-N-acetylmuramate dehydrogenase [Candidatus Doudnabacteria bacterium]|nr:UDP-N-acetylmuramate dehydrogenase [Candidatus Doudnabacteria bacterium]
MALKVQENYPLKQLTTFEIGGLAAFYTQVTSLEEVREALEFAHQKSLKIFILGGGSNVLISDEGFSGLVIHNQIQDLSFKIKDDEALVTIGAGEDWDEVVKRCVEQDLAGIECLSGIPGSAGGAVVQNIGAYGQTISDVLEEVEAVECGSGNIVKFNREQCGFEYRDSDFKKNPGKYIVTKFRLSLVPHGRSVLNYQDLVKYFSNQNQHSLRDVRKAVIEIRAKKGNVILPGFEKFKTAGSFFKNPIVSREEFDKIKFLVKKNGGESDCQDPWFWGVEDGKIKLAAACLLASAGFRKGYKQGRVGISPKHPLALINIGEATAREMLALSWNIKQAVKSKFGVELEAEVKLLNYE